MLSPEEKAAVEAILADVAPTDNGSPIQGLPAKLVAVRRARPTNESEREALLAARQSILVALGHRKLMTLYTAAIAGNWPE